MNLSPSTYPEVLEFAKAAQCVSWSRLSPRTLSCVFDNVPADRRTCMDLRIDSGKCGLVEIRTLSGYDAAKHVWRNAGESPRGTIVLPDKRGLKTLLAWVAEQATIQTGWANPESFSIYRK